MSAHFFFHLIALHLALFMTVLLCQCFALLETVHVGHLRLEISIVYLVFSTPHRLANQNCGLSAELSLVHSERNDGLQNHSFKFQYFFALISDRRLAFGFNITQSLCWKCTAFFPPSDESTPDTRQSRKQTFFSFFSAAVLTTVKCDLFKTRYMFLRGRRGKLRTVLK